MSDPNSEPGTPFTGRDVPSALMCQTLLDRELVRPSPSGR